MELIFWNSYYGYFDFTWIMSVLNGIWNEKSFPEGFKFLLPRSIIGITLCCSYSIIKCISSVIGLESQNYSLIHGLQNGCCVSRDEKILISLCISFWGFPGGTSGKEPTCQCSKMWEPRVLLSSNRVRLLGMKISHLLSKLLAIVYHPLYYPLELWRLK